MILSLSPAKRKEFNTIYHATHGRLYNTFLKLTKDETLVKDILQQCYLKLWENWEQITDKTDIYPLLFTYSRNIFIDELRKIKARKTLLQHISASGENSVSSEEHYILKECLATVNTAVKHMPARRREVYKLALEEGMSRRNIADLLSLSPNTIDCHLQEAMKTIRTIVNS
ncbi:RNA polymerase sigma factor, sigma-70 family [Chitinophaga sp. YR627]|uniref:RNA polymerase sigma factor n=1 Tax=Chitinophaga sp. YR627 TaxID=1881041 RepID=UPI0008E01513|nr:sigma-70 family RNA polymerase sigma factor [Chitinophaga sp. YR627]SFO77568.1 RNA polymerase sigma factor, sigma-70 family [Chitinophaga sp. YR627]